MTTQYTSILKLALPVQGELSGTWGDVVNDNITSMIEEAIAGRSVINTWTANAHTLTTADGTTSESRAAMLEFTDTGAALSGNAEVICPTASKIYIAKNAVGSSRTVTLKTSAGTGIAIPDGTTMLLFCDGTNVVEAVTNINSLSVGGYTVTLAGAVSTAAAFSTAGANALTLTTTGTTNVTLPTTGTLATLAGTETFTNKTLTSPDINGGSVDNATIGATTPSTGVFTNLTANTDLTLATGATVTGINTTTDMSDASTTTLATSDSIKQYVDAQVGANNELSEVLANGNTTGANNIIVDAGQSITTDSILETTAAAGVDIDGILLKDTSVGTDDASGTDIAGTNVTLRGGAGTGTGAGGSLIFQTAPAGTTGSTPNAQATALTIDSAGDATFTGASYNMSWDKSANSLTFADNAKAVFGAGSDLQIYHDGVASYIHDVGTGNLKLLGTNLSIRNADDSKYYLFAQDGGSAAIYHDGNNKLQTTATGINVTGTIIGDGLTVQGDATITGASSPSLTVTDTTNTVNTVLQSFNTTAIVGTTSNHDFLVYANNLPITKFFAGGDVQFYEDTGTTPKLFWDASAESLSIGTTTAGRKLQVYGGTAGATDSRNFRIADSGGTTGNRYDFSLENTGALAINNGTSDIPLVKFHNNSDFSLGNASGTTKLFWDASASSLGIGTTSPSSVLTAVTSSNANNIQIRRDSTTTSDYAQLGFSVSTGTTADNNAEIRAIRTNSPNVGDTEIAFLNRGSGAGPTERMRIDSSGNVIFGTTGQGYINGAAPNTYNSGYDQDDDSFATWINFSGYQGGTTRYRDLIVGDGKNARVATFDGSSGNVGIGTSSPTFASGYSGLHINKDYPEIHLTNTNSGATASDGFKIQQNSSSNVFLWNYENAFLAIGTNNTERMRIDSSGNVGIGATTPGRLLELKESSTGAGDAIIRLRGHGNDANNTPLGSLEWFNTDPSGDQPGVVAAIEAQSDNPSGHMGKLLFKTHDGSEGGEGSSPVERMRITSSGNVGIGTASPSALLEVATPSSGSAAVFNLLDNTADGFVVKQGSNEYISVDTTNSAEVITLGNTTTIADVIIPAGNVGIGTTSPSYQLSVAGATESSIQILAGTNSSNSVLRFGDSDAASPGSLLYDHSANSLRFNVNAGERMRIDSSGNLLVAGTSALTTSTSIQPTFQIIGQGAATGSMYISRDEASASPAAIYGYKSRNSGAIVLDNDELFALIVEGSDGVGPIRAGSIKFEVDGTPATNNIPTAIVFERSDGAAGLTESMRIDSSGNVGIGQAPTAFSNWKVLELKGGTAGAMLNFENSASTRVSAVAYDDSLDTLRIQNFLANPIRFETDNTERMRIDSSGNLLVGSTSFNKDVNGVYSGNDGLFYATATPGATELVASFNRKSTDGGIIRLQKDGTTVGSIGVGDGDNLYISGSAGSTKGLIFNDNSVIPAANGYNVSDNTTNLGSSTGRFKDLYLSGGVYVGGTVAANKLDDYEEGTFTPTVAGDATGAFGAAEGYYTKVGRLVFIELYFTVGTNFTSNTVGGLPFTVANLATGTSYGQNAVVLTSAADTVTGAAQEATTNATFYNDHNILSTHAPNSTNSAYRLSMCYQST